MNKRRMSVFVERREKKKGVRVEVCEYNRSVVNVYGEERKDCECGCGEERGGERNECRKEEDVMWSGVFVCECI